MPLFVLGANAMCQLGLPESVDSTHVPISHEYFVNKKIKKICTGKLHSLVLCENNELYSWGVNDDCALGREGNQGVPELVDFKYNIVDICAGASYSAILTDKGHVYACGTFKSSSGVFGFDSDNKFQKIFKKIQNLRKIQKIFSGQNHLILIDKDSNIWTFGANEAGQLGRRHRERRSERCLDPSQISSVNKKDNTNLFITASGGGCHSMAVNQNKECYGWGGNYNGQLGDGTIIGSELKRKALIENVIEVACGSSHTLFLLENKALYGTGDNTLSQLGIRGEKMFKTPVHIMSDIDKIRAGCDFTIAQKGNKLYVWGSNLNGELGFDEIKYDEIFTPIAMEFNFKKIIDFSCGTDFTLIHTE